MPIQYYIVKNSLTVPVSYTGKPVPVNVLQIEDIANRINLSIPNITAELAKSVLELFGTVVKIEIATGNAVTLENFASFKMLMPGRINLSNDSIDFDKVKCSFIPAATFKDGVRAIATYLRLGVLDDKSPEIVLVKDTNTAIKNWIREGYAVEITGANLNFDIADQAQGLFLTSPAGNVIRVDNIPLLTAKKIIAIPTIDPNEGPAGKASVAYSMAVKTRYSGSSEIKTGGYEMARKTDFIDGDNDEVFVRSNAASGPARIAAYTGEPMTARIVAAIRPDNVLTISAGTLMGELGAAVQVTGNGTYSVAGLDGLEIEVTDYTKLYSNVISCQRNIQEVVKIGGESPSVSYLFQSYTKRYVNLWQYRDAIWTGEKFFAIAAQYSFEYIADIAWSSDAINVYSIEHNSIPQFNWSRIVHDDVRNILLLGSWNQSVYAKSTNDGQSWTQYSLPNTWFPNNPSFKALCFGNGMFVGMHSSVSTPQAPQLWYSTDGESFTPITIEAANWTAMAFGNDVFIGISGGYIGRGKICRFDGTTATVLSNIIPLYMWNDIAFGDGKFVATAYGDKFIVSEDNGFTWSEITVPISKDWERIKYFNGKWTAIASNATDSCIMQSADLSEWEVLSRPDTIGSALIALAGHENGAMIFALNSVAEGPRCFINFDQESIQQLENEVAVNISVEQGEMLYFKASVPAAKTQIQIDLYNLTGDLDLYIGIDYLPSSIFNDGESENGGDTIEQVAVANTADTIYGIGVFGYNEGSGTIKITLS